MKILHLVPTGSWYGSEVMASAIAGQQAEEHEVGLVWRCGSGFPPSSVRARVPRRVKLYAMPAEIAEPCHQVAWLARQPLDRPDILHAHLGPGARLARELSAGGVPWVGSLHIRFYWSHFFDSDGVIAISPWQLRDIPKRYSGIRAVAPNFMDAPRPPQPREVESYRRRAYADTDSFVIGSIGRLHLDKGLDILCEAFAAARLPNARLLLIGEGPERPRLQQFASRCPDIILTGYFSNASRALSAMDLYVSSSRSEPFGMTILEAMHFGVPIVATASLGATDLLGESQPLVPVGDVEGLTEALREAYRERRGRTSYDLSRFAPSEAIQTIAGAYEDVLERRRSRPITGPGRRRPRFRLPFHGRRAGDR